MKYMRINAKRWTSLFLVMFAFGFYGLMQSRTATMAPVDGNQTKFDQAAALAKLRESIKGKEKEPAETVFKNIQTLKGVPAGRLLAIMEFGYARSLGVNCTHCHTPDQWEKEDKTQKQTTRDMAAMSKTINTELLKNIKNLKSTTPTINCTTCHRGDIRPALDLPPPVASPITIPPPPTKPVLT